MKQLDIPTFAERLLGVTIPENGVMYACSYDGLHRISLALPVSLTTDEGKQQDYASLEALGDALGIMGGSPLLEYGSTKLSYEFLVENEDQLVFVTYGHMNETITFPILSGDWFYATLSKDGRFVLLAEPYSIAIYELEK